MSAILLFRKPFSTERKDQVRHRQEAVLLGGLARLFNGDEYACDLLGRERFNNTRDKNIFSGRFSRFQQRNQRGRVWTSGYKRTNPVGGGVKKCNRDHLIGRGAYLPGRSHHLSRFHQSHCGLEPVSILGHRSRIICSRGCVYGEKIQGRITPSDRRSCHTAARHIHVVETIFLAEILENTQSCLSESPGSFELSSRKKHSSSGLDLWFYD